MTKTIDIKLLPSSVAAFTEALWGDSGSLDAWLEANDESEVAQHIEAYASACVSNAIAETVHVSANKIEELRVALAVLKAENEMLREALKDADNELDWFDEDMDTCDHSVGVCMCSYWSMRQKMKTTLGRSGQQ